MSSDFLTSLSLRAIQNAGTEAVVGALRPRLASRFEPAILNARQGMDENIENIQVEVSGIPEANPRPRKKSATAEENRSEVQMNHSVQRERPSQGSLFAPLQREIIANPFPGTIEDQIVPDRVHPVAIDHHLETPQVSSLQTVANLVQPPGLHQAETGDSRQAPLLSSPVVIACSEPVQAIEPHENRDPLHVLHTYETLMEPKSSLPIESINQQADQPKVVSERIEITHKESQLLISNIQQQLVSSIPRPAKRSQATIRETEPTINVTIGRIEVKATAPIPAPKRNVSTAHTMSLDEYLQRRQGGQQ